MDILGQMVQDDAVLEYEATCSMGSTLPPYPMEEIDVRIVEELNARIDEAEEQFARGEYYTSDEVHRGVLDFLNSRKCS